MTTIALTVPADEDLLPLSVLLHQRGVAHRVYEDGGQQVLEVEGGEQQAQQVKALYLAWRNGSVEIEVSGKQSARSTTFTVPWRHLPVTLLLLVLSLIGFLVVYLGAPLSWLGELTFTPFVIEDQQLVFGDLGSDYWRLVTPAFLHFGWLHIVFNGLWLWELGKRVEAVLGSTNMLLLFLVIALVSNACQYMFGGPGIFGGMSGVVYGLLGFAWMAPWLQPRWHIQPAPVIMMFMIGWLVICMAGLVEVLGFGRIANAAHLGGLICGGLLGITFGLLSRLGEKNNG